MLSLRQTLTMLPAKKTRATKPIQKNADGAWPWECALIASKIDNAAAKIQMAIKKMADVRVAARFASRICGASAGTGFSVTNRPNHTSALTWASRAADTAQPCPQWHAKPTQPGSSCSDCAQIGC